MCGITGVYDPNKKIDEAMLVDLSSTLHHRGPDDAGVFLDNDKSIGLGHRRLSVIDLSSGGHQPMEKGGLVIVYNGEIYNFKEVRKELESLGINFSTNSDTEVVLESFRLWKKEAVNKFRGMFAFCVWDKDERKLTLFRDRAGVKPLYYYYKDGLFMFASELRAITQHPRFVKKINHDALAIFLQLGYIPAPLSIFQDIYKLEPGHFLEVDNNGIKKGKYWSVVDIYKTSPKYNRYDEKKATLELEDKLQDAFMLRTVSDVPIGVFLSGGVDSTLLTALLKKNYKGNLDTFTVGFEESSHNEAHYSKRIAKYLGTNHHEVYLKPEQAKHIIPLLPQIYDEPFGDPSAIPTYLVSEFVKQKVKVALSADGGDELFCGYSRYPKVAQIHEKMSNMNAFSVSGIKILDNPLSRPFLEKYGKGRLLFAGNNLSHIYKNFRNYYSDTEIRNFLNIVPSENYGWSHWHHFDEIKEIDTLTQLQIFDFNTYMADDILVKVDRASMAVSLEAREPFLDHKIIEYAASLPISLKYRDGQGKFILRKILDKYIPHELVDRQKKGFGVPLDSWLKSDLSHLVDRYLNEDIIRSGGIFNLEKIQKEKQMFLSGKKSYRRIWNLIVFQMWKEQWGT